MKPDSNSREQILTAIRSRSKRALSGMADRHSIVIPSPMYKDAPFHGLVKQFFEMLEMVHGSGDEVDELQEIPAAVSRYLQKHNLEFRILVSPDSMFEQIDWKELNVDFRAADKSDQVSVTLACCGIAETGTVALVSSPSSPTSLNFLPENNIVILLKSRLLQGIEEFWPKLESEPRAINFITGPSKTADIEQTIVYGAHGPRRFHVVLVNNL